MPAGRRFRGTGELGVWPPFMFGLDDPILCEVCLETKRNESTDHKETFLLASHSLRVEANHHARKVENYFVNNSKSLSISPRRLESGLRMRDAL
jgi:hypothetical protein